MLSYKLNNSVIYYHLILFISFCVSVNYFIELKYLNIFFYVFFHLTFIYLTFYYHNISLYFTGFFYGILFDLFLVNYIGTHLIVFLLFLSLILFIKKFLIIYSSNRISIIILFLLFFILFLEMFIAQIAFNYSFKFETFIIFCVIGLFSIVPCFYFFKRLDNL